MAVKEEIEVIRKNQDSTSIVLSPDWLNIFIRRNIASPAKNPFREKYLPGRHGNKIGVTTIPPQ